MKMSPELMDKLIAKYPRQFRMLKWIECEDGWYDLIDKACFRIQNRLKHLNKPENDETDFCWSQIKEKFGGIRLYCYGADDYVRGIVDMAEEMSLGICEFTGNKGKVRNLMINQKGEVVRASWLKTLSDDQALKLGYK